MSVDFDAEYTRYQSERSALRKFVRRAYLRRAASQVEGKTLDFGCGVGELLACLPAGSTGVEYNQATVEFCRRKGLGVSHYDGEQDGWSLSQFSEKDALRSLVISHVLEHLGDPMVVLDRLMTASERLGIQRILIIVPGRAGFRIDPTHRTFVDEEMLRQGVQGHRNWRVSDSFYFPFNASRVGDFFVYNEYHLLLTRST